MLKSDYEPYGPGNSASNLMDPITLIYGSSSTAQKPKPELQMEPEVNTVGYDDIDFQKVIIGSPVRGSSKVIVRR